uniref:Uncharacterized protein n=1 Tax=Triticum urartu TaxID=4572 RepID=A0A8R7U4I6_TRIUA
MKIFIDEKPCPLACKYEDTPTQHQDQITHFINVQVNKFFYCGRTCTGHGPHTPSTPCP